jgi:gliding motility-associated transport system permease protein
MIALYFKELGSFFNSLIGYLVVGIFLIINGLILWVFPSQFNIIESGYANIDSLFILAPWIFLFLVPAVTMRLFSDEKKSGTIEFIMTKPIGDLQIIFAKYFAGLSIVIIAILPSLIYFASVYILGNPIGNIDSGGTWGSYIGLIFLSGVYVSIGLFASSITENQIISFLIGLVLSLIVFIGFETLSSMNFMFSFKNFLIQIGINEHYRSMSRGVLDSRDIIYFLSAISIFILATKIVLESRKW